METTTQEAEVIQPEPVLPVAVQKTNAMVRPGVGVLFQSVAEVWNVAKNLKDGGAGPPKSTTASIFASILKGQSLGLDPVTSMSFITIVNGRASLMGDLALGLVRKSGLVNPKAGGYLREEWTGEGEARTCTMSAKRHDTGEEMTRSFSTAQARAALLIGKTAIWTGFHDRMLRYRAMGFLLRDLFSDILLGLYLTEELQSGDYFATPASPQLPTGTEALALPEPRKDPFFEPAAEPEVIDPALVSVVAVEIAEVQKAPKAQEAAGATSGTVDGPIIVGDVERAAAAQGLDEASLAATAEKVLAVLAAEPAPNSPEDPFRGFRDPDPAAAPVTLAPSTRTQSKPRAARKPAPRPALPSSTVVRKPGQIGGEW